MKQDSNLFRNLVKCLNKNVAFDQLHTFTDRSKGKKVIVHKSHTTTTSPVKPSSRSMKANIKQKRA